MAIVIELDVMLARRKVRSKELAEKIGITVQNLSILKTGKARAIRFSTLDAICQELDCQPGEILRYEPDTVEEVQDQASLHPMRRDQMEKNYCVRFLELSFAECGSSGKGT